MPPHRTTPSGYDHARRLRKESTQAELRLWAYLRDKRLCGVTFRRQHAIGPYVADFCAPRHQLIVEVDGAQHMERQEQDAERTAYLASEGYRVLRFWNHDVLHNIEGVVEAIREALQVEDSLPPPASPTPSGPPGHLPQMHM